MIEDDFILCPITYTVTLSELIQKYYPGRDAKFSWDIRDIWNHKSNTGHIQGFLNLTNIGDDIENEVSYNNFFLVGFQNGIMWCHLDYGIHNVIEESVRIFDVPVFRWNKDEKALYVNPKLFDLQPIRSHYYINNKQYTLKKWMQCCKIDNLNKLGAKLAQQKVNS